MKKNAVNSKKGFTIIEVVLVLAIAGLIFLMVFIALPTLQTSQRDTQRRNDMNTVAAQITQYQTNNGGELPSYGSAAAGECVDGDTFHDNYIANLGDPATGSYSVKICNPASTATANGASSDQGVIKIYIGASCEGENAATETSDRLYAVLYKLEGSGTVCVDNK